MYVNIIFECNNFGNFFKDSIWLKIKNSIFFIITSIENIHRIVAYQKEK